MSNDLFFEGVAIAAATARGRHSPKITMQDAQLLNRAYAGAMQTGSIQFEDETSCKAEVAGAFLRFVDPPSESALIAALPAGSPSPSMIQEVILVGDDFRASEQQAGDLLCGAQVGLILLNPQISKGTLANDWGTFMELYPRARQRYLLNGVPEAAIPTLFAKEVIHFRLNYGSALPRGVGFFRGLWTNFGKRFGYLAVKTDPEQASVWVDEEDWGLSPTSAGTEAGPHVVSAAKADKKKAVEVTVPPMGTAEARIDLK